MAVAARPIPDRFADDVRQMVRDLTTIEINTIVTESILGTKMPGIRHALVQIARDYDRQLSLYGMARPLGADGALPPSMKGGRQAFEDLHDRAKHLGSWLQLRADAHVRNPAFDPPLTADERQMLQMACRIEEKSSQLKGLFNALAVRGEPLLQHREIHADALHNDYGHDEIEEKQALLGRKFDLPVSTEHVVLVRKIWDIGTENIALQTIVQLDGDIVTRIHAGYLGEDQEVTRRIHDKMIVTAIGTWDSLVRLVGDFFRSAAAVFLPK